jgi:hypothetical protein
MIMVQSPRKVPRKDSITGLRLCSLDITADRDFALVDIAGGRCKHYDNGNETRETNEGQADVVAREDGPGFHLFFVTVVIIAPFSRKAKGG